jgi:hypothetical protein
VELLLLDLVDDPPAVLFPLLLLVLVKDWLEMLAWLEHEFDNKLVTEMVLLNSDDYSVLIFIITISEQKIMKKPFCGTPLMHRPFREPPTLPFPNSEDCQTGPRNKTLEESPSASVLWGGPTLHL